MIEVRKSDDQGFYYAVEIDDKGNESLVVEAEKLDVVLAHTKLKGFKGSPVPESSIRGNRPAPKSLEQAPDSK